MQGMPPGMPTMDGDMMANMINNPMVKEMMSNPDFMKQA
jgi:hypothetical protein